MVALTAILGLVALGAGAVAIEAVTHGRARAALMRSHARHQALAVAAARQADAMDADFARWEIAAARLVGRASEAAATPAAADPATPLYSPTTFEVGQGAPADLARSKRYRDRISVDAPVVQVAPGVELTGDTYQQALRVAGLRGPLQGALLATSPDPTLILSADSARALLLADGVPALRAFVSLASGVHVSYPGAGGYEAGYDARRRKKYTSVLAQATTSARRVHWGDLYADRNGLGLVLPVGGALLDRGEQVAGVAGLELSLAWIAQHLLPMPDAPWALEYFLLDADGKVIVRLPAGGTPEYPAAAAAGESEEIAALELPHAAAREAVESAHAGVVELADGHLAALYPLSTIDYTFVVVADPAKLIVGDR
jgi:hypothetical protein